MIALLQSFIDSIIAVANFFWHTISSLFIFITHIPVYLTFIVSSLSVLPAVIVPFAIVSIYIYVMYFILSRE